MTGAIDDKAVADIGVEVDFNAAQNDTSVECAAHGELRFSGEDTRRAGGGWAPGGVVGRGADAGEAAAAPAAGPPPVPPVNRPGSAAIAALPAMRGALRSPSARAAWPAGSAA